MIALTIIQQSANVRFKLIVTFYSISHSTFYFKISMLFLHNVTTLKNWQHCFEFVNKKMIQQLLIVITDVEITNLNVLKSFKKESQSLIEFYKLANLKHQISQQT